MSIHEFSEALQHRTVRNLLHNTQNILNTKAEDLRPKEITKGKTSFTISSLDIRRMLKVMKPFDKTEISDEEIVKRLKLAKTAFEKRSKNNLPVKYFTTKKGVTHLVFNEVYYTTPKDRKNGIDEILDDIFGKEEIAVSDHYHKGHVRALATASLGTVVQRIKSSSSKHSTVKELSGILEHILKHLEELDKASSNIPEVFGTIVAHSTKKYNKHLVEFQLKKPNEESGRISGTITGPLRAFINSATSLKDGPQSSYNALTKALKETGASTKLMKMLASKRGSPSFLELLELRLLHILDPDNAKFKNDKTYSLKNVPAGKLRLFKPDAASIRQLQNEIRLEISNLKKLKAGLNAADDGLAGVQQLAGDATLLFYMTEEGQEGRDAYKERRKPNFGKYPKRP